MRIIYIGILAAALLLCGTFFIDVNQPVPTKVSYEDMIPSARKQIDCLAQNIYYEAGNQTDDGKIAVALVTMNRVKSGHFSNSICNVVKEKHGKMCQFTWWCEGKTKAVDRKRFERSKDMALYVYLNHDKVKDITKGATFYHADYVKPGWDKLKRTTQIGAHIFYKTNTKDTKYDEQSQSPSWWQFKSSTEFFSVADGRHFSPIL